MKLWKMPPTNHSAKKPGLDCVKGQVCAWVPSSLCLHELKCVCTKDRVGFGCQGAVVKLGWAGGYCQFNLLMEDTVLGLSEGCVDQGSIIFLQVSLCQLPQLVRISSWTHMALKQLLTCGQLLCILAVIDAGGGPGLPWVRRESQSLLQRCRL